MSANTRSKAGNKHQSSPPPMSDSQRPSDSNPCPADALFTQGMANGLSQAQREKYAVLFKEDGNALYKEKKFLEAIQFYTAAIGLKEDAVFYSNRSACYVGLKDYHMVVKDTTAALKLQPDFTKCLLRRSAVYEKLGQYEDSVFDSMSVMLYETDRQKLDQAISANKNTIEKALVKIIEKMEKERGLKLPCADNIMEHIGGMDKETTVEGLPQDPSKLPVDSGDFFLISALQTMHSKPTDRYIRADEFFQKALSVYLNQVSSSPNDQLLKRKLAVAHEYVGLFKYFKNDQTYTDDLNRAVALDPKRSRSFVILGFIYTELSMNKDAEFALNKAIALSPKSGEANYQMGLYYEKLFHQSANRTYLEKANEFYKKSKLARPGNVYSMMRLMNVALVMGDHDALKKLEVTARENFARTPEYANYSGELLREANDWAGALGQFQLAVVLGDIAPHATIRVVQITNAVEMLTTGEPKDLDKTVAYELLEKAISIDATSESAKICLGGLKMMDGKDDEAIALYKEAASLCGTPSNRISAAGFAFIQEIDSRFKRSPGLSEKFKTLDVMSAFSNFYNPGLRGWAEFLANSCPCPTCQSLNNTNNSNNTNNRNRR